MEKMKRTKKLAFNQSKVKQRFAIRKLTVGAASVLLGLTFLGVNGNQVKADTETGNQIESSQVVNNDQSQTSSDASSNSESNTNEQSTSEQGQNNENKNVQISTESVDNNNNNTRPEQAPTRTEKDPMDQAVVAGDNNTSNPNKVNGEGNNEKLTHVPSNGTIIYDYSISAKNKKDGQVQTVNSGDTGHDNNATIVTKNADDIEAHLSLTNTSNTTQHVGPNDSGDVVRLFINAWTGPVGTLKVDGSKAANIVFIKDDQVENNDALPVYYLASDGRWLTYADMVSNFGQDAISKVTQVGIRGDIPANTTAQMNVPLVVDASAPLSRNQISTNGLGSKSVYVNTYNGKSLWSTDEIANERLYLTTRDPDGSYSVVDDQGWFNQLPKAGDVVRITNSGNPFSTENTTLYSGGQYRIYLADIQRVLQEHGYSVDPQNNNLELPMDYYSYTATSGLQIHNSDKSPFTPVEGHPFFYIEVHKIVNTKDMTFEEGSTEAQNWNAQQGVVNVFNVDNPRAVSNGHQYIDDKGSIQDTQLVSIVDSNGRTISAIDGNTPAGTYTVTVAYKLNGSTQNSMLIRNTYVVTVTPKPVQPEQPVTPPDNNNNNQPGNNQPSNNQSEDSGQTNQSSTDSNQSTLPVPVADSDNSAPDTDENNRPLPEDQPTKSEKEQPKKQNVVAPKAHEQKKTSVPAPHSLNNANSSKAPAAQVKSVKNDVVKQKTTAPVVKATKAELPRTGEKKNTLALVGLSLATIGLFGLAVFRKKN